MDLSLTLNYLFPGADPLTDYTLQDDGNGPYIAAWHLADPQPTQADLDAAYPKARKGQLRTYTKAFAGNRIVARIPEWKQRNLTARTSELLRIKSDRALTTEEQAEMDANQAEWDWVKSVRSFSDGLEVDIDAGTITTEAEIDGALWP